MCNPTDDIASKTYFLDLKNGCDSSTNIGVFLLFPEFREFCENQGFSNFGPFEALAVKSKGAED